MSDTTVHLSPYSVVTSKITEILRELRALRLLKRGGIILHLVEIGQGHTQF